MDKRQLVEFVRELGLEKGEYALFGGSCLTIRGLRKSPDVDIFISENLYEKFVSEGWKEVASKKDNKPYLVKTVRGVPVQAFSVWEKINWRPDITSYLTNPEVLDDIAFMPLSELYEWKKAVRRPKDVTDLGLIERYWATSRGAGFISQRI